MKAKEFFIKLKQNPDFNAFQVEQPEDWEIDMARERSPYKFLADIWAEADAVRKQYLKMMTMKS